MWEGPGCHHFKRQAGKLAEQLGPGLELVAGCGVLGLQGGVEARTIVTHRDSQTADRLLLCPSNLPPAIVSPTGPRSGS